MRTKEQTAEEVFKAFSKEMYEWNLMCIDLDSNDAMDESEKDEKIKSELDRIFEEYLTIRKRTNGRQAGYNFSTPPEYNPKKNEILSCVIDGKKAYIEVQETDGFQKKLKYTLHQKEDGWRVDKKESYDDVFKNKWIADIL